MTEDDRLIALCCCESCGQFASAAFAEIRLLRARLAVVQSAVTLETRASRRQVDALLMLGGETGRAGSGFGERG